MNPEPELGEAAPPEAESQPTAAAPPRLNSLTGSAPNVPIRPPPTAASRPANHNAAAGAARRATSMEDQYTAFTQISNTILNRIRNSINGVPYSSGMTFERHIITIHRFRNIFNMYMNEIGDELDELTRQFGLFYPTAPPIPPGIPLVQQLDPPPLDLILEHPDPPGQNSTLDTPATTDSDDEDIHQGEEEEEEYADDEEGEEEEEDDNDTVGDGEEEENEDVGEAEEREPNEIDEPEHGDEESPEQEVVTCAGKVNEDVLNEIGGDGEVNEEEVLNHSDGEEVLHEGDTEINEDEILNDSDVDEGHQQSIRVVDKIDIDEDSSSSTATLPLNAQDQDDIDEDEVIETESISNRELESPFTQQSSTSQSQSLLPTPSASRITVPFELIQPQPCVVKLTRLTNQQLRTLKTSGNYLPRGRTSIHDESTDEELLAPTENEEEGSTSEMRNILAELLRVESNLYMPMNMKIEPDLYEEVDDAGNDDEEEEGKEKPIPQVKKPEPKKKKVRTKKEKDRLMEWIQNQANLESDTESDNNQFASSAESNGELSDSDLPDESLYLNSPSPLDNEESHRLTDSTSDFGSQKDIDLMENMDDEEHFRRMIVDSGDSEFSSDEDDEKTWKEKVMKTPESHNNEREKGKENKTNSSKRKHVSGIPAMPSSLSDDDDSDARSNSPIELDESDSEPDLIELNSSADELDEDEDIKFIEEIKSSDDILILNSSKPAKRPRLELEVSMTESQSQIQSDAISVDRFSQHSSSSSARARKIRDIIPASQLSQPTKVAITHERNRLSRLDRKHKMQEEFLKICPDTTGFVLECDPISKEPVVKIHPFLTTHLKDYQVTGVRFLYECCYESVSKAAEPNSGSGCILAHCMGLGKTLQALAFCHTVLTAPCLDTKHILVIAPLSTVNNWINEHGHWIKPIHDMKIFNLASSDRPESLNEKLKKLRTWERAGGVAVINYEAAQRLVQPKGDIKSFTGNRKILYELAIKLLSDPGPDIVICDEGHRLKNRQTKNYKTVELIKTKRKIILTGTPIQNHLVEYYSMCNLVKPNVLGNPEEFQNRYVNPIQNGQLVDSLESDVKKMKRRIWSLTNEVKGFVLRNQLDVLKNVLKPKYEYSIVIKLSEMQDKLYKRCVEFIARERDNTRRTNVLVFYHLLQKICCHPKLILEKPPARTITEKENAKASIKNREGLDLDLSQIANIEAENELEELRVTWLETILQDINKEEIRNDWSISGKLIVLGDIIQECEKLGEKLLVFSRYTRALDLIEEYLGHMGGFKHGENYLRLDGSTKTATRSAYCNKFNEDPKYKFFLISKLTGGLGINLHGANRVVLFDVSFNPSEDSQSIFRVYRIGQNKPCFVYRLISEGTTEERIYCRSILKLVLSSRLVDKQQPGRHFTANDVGYLFYYTGQSELPLAANPPEDELLRGLKERRKEWISLHAEHDFLLADRADEALKPEEISIAVQEIENEKSEKAAAAAAAASAENRAPPPNPKKRGRKPKVKDNLSDANTSGASGSAPANGNRGGLMDQFIQSSSNADPCATDNLSILECLLGAETESIVKKIHNYLRETNPELVQTQTQTANYLYDILYRLQESYRSNSGGIGEYEWSNQDQRELTFLTMALGYSQTEEIVQRIR